MKIDINENIVKIAAHINELRNEMLRLEGSLRTLQNMKEMGVKHIDIKDESIVDTKEITNGSIQN